MSTNSTIAVKTNNKVKIIYCHWDGYIEGVGKTLLNHYHTQEKIESLVNLGDLSVLDISIACPSGHTFENRIKGYSLFYGRDRGETDIGADKHDDHKSALRWGNKGAQQYNYYWDGEKWLVNGKLLSDIVIEY